MQQKKNIKPGTCDVKFCIKTPPKGRSRCDACRRKEWREKYPIKAAYANLRGSARKRNIEFTLTLEEFTQFCYETEYIQNKGRTKTSYTVDRIDNDKGYTIENIRILTMSENASKGAKKLEYDWLTGEARVVRVEKDNNEEGPF